MKRRGGAASGFAYRGELPLLAQLSVGAGLVGLMAVIGMRVHQTNARLRAVRNSLQQQREELVNLNSLAHAVNAHLDVDVIMKSLMQAMQRLYPFEALYILTFDEPNQKVEVFGVYGSSMTEQEHAAFRRFKFDLQRDGDSVFVRSLLKRKTVYLPKITPAIMAQSAPVDAELYAIKPSVSLAYFPVVVQDRVVAGAAFINYEKNFDLQPRDLESIQQLLVQVGTAVRNAALFRELADAKEKAELAQQKAQASEETKSRFLANMSHEIRTPLTAIMGYSEALAEDGLSRDDRTKFVSHVLRSGKHLLSMINDILDISKIEARKIQVEQLSCNLVEVLCDIDSYMQIRTQAKKLEYRLDLEFPIPQTMVTDPTRLKQILLNLGNNAVKFTSDGEITVRLKVIQEGILEIRIADTGVGIGDAEKSRIFNAFDQADTSTTRLFGGTGLGLYISKNLAQLLGGDLTFESCKGVGSTFVLTLPFGTHTGTYILDAEQFAHYLADVQESKTYSGVPKLSGRVLVAEDNPENRSLVTRLIRQTGMEVDVVEDGSSAVAAATGTEYSVILMDMQMPVMGGREAALVLRQHQVATPLVAFTANVMKHQMEEYEKLGFAAVVEKPISRDVLFQTLKRVLHKPLQRSCKVLIAEDNEVNQMILFRYVTRACEQTEVTLAANGQEAVEWVKKQKFDLILMDMEMPVLGGLAATERIRALGDDTPLYIVSGNVSPEDRARALRAGATGHVAKPLDKDQILLLIEQTLS